MNSLNHRIFQLFWTLFLIPLVLSLDTPETFIDSLQQRAPSSTFSLSSGILSLSIVSASASFNTTSTLDQIVVTLGSGTWTGTDGSGITGNGLNTLDISSGAVISYIDVVATVACTITLSGTNTYTRQLQITASIPLSRVTVGRSVWAAALQVTSQQVWVTGSITSTANISLTGDNHLSTGYFDSLIRGSASGMWITGNITTTEHLLLAGYGKVRCLFSG